MSTPFPPPSVAVRPATDDDIPALRSIEVAAGRLFLGVGLPTIAADPPPTAESLRVAIARGDVVVGSAPDTAGPVGYLSVRTVPGEALHIEQVSVDPAFGRRGIGTALVRHAATVAARRGLDLVTLTTFLDVPWNGPFYAARGFEPLPDDEASGWLREIRLRETVHGLDVAPRGIMVRRLSPRRADAPVTG